MKKYIVRGNESFIFESFERPFISALLGPRRVGKTTLLQYYMSLHPEKKWIHLNMDVLSQRNRVAAEELEIMIEEVALQKIGIFCYMGPFSFDKENRILFLPAWMI